LVIAAGASNYCSSFGGWIGENTETSFSLLVMCEEMETDKILMIFFHNFLLSSFLER
jgi:hypothetical protein